MLAARRFMKHVTKTCCYIHNRYTCTIAYVHIGQCVHNIHVVHIREVDLEHGYDKCTVTYSWSNVVVCTKLYNVIVLPMQTFEVYGDE